MAMRMAFVFQECERIEVIKSLKANHNLREPNTSATKDIADKNILIIDKVIYKRTTLKFAIIAFSKQQPNKIHFLAFGKSQRFVIKNQQHGKNSRFKINKKCHWQGNTRYVKHEVSCKVAGRHV